MSIKYKVEYLAFPSNEFPCFGFVICIKNGKQFLPEYDKNNRVDNFLEVEFNLHELHRFDLDYYIKKNDERTYTYYYKKNKIFLGHRDKIQTDLLKILNTIKDAPFSKLDLAKFLNSEPKTVLKIKDECFKFLYKIDKEYAENWKLSNYMDTPPKSEKPIWEEKYEELPHRRIKEICRVAAKLQTDKWKIYKPLKAIA